MVLYVVTLPDPAPGTDFQFVVPGRYLYDVTGITAQLATGGTSGTVMADASGNGNDGTYTPFGPGTPHIIFVPGLVAGNDAIRGALASGAPRGGAEVTLPILDCTADFTIVWWQSCGPAFAGTGVGPVELIDAGSMTIVAVTTTPGPGGTLEVDVGFGVAGITATGVVPDDGAAHMFAVAYNAGTSDLTAYIDGTVVPWVSGGTMTFASPTFEVIIGFNEPPEIFDEYVFVQSELAGADVAALYAAGVAGYGAWVPAVMGFAPTAFYHMDGAIPGTGRQPSLIVTNGTTELEAIPTGFPAVSTPGPYEYSWQPALNADTQSTDGTLTTVAIPELLLPAGYTVGPRTIDLQPGDQWSNVALWWDDAYQAAFDPFNDYVFPGGIKLVYQQVGAQP